MSPAAMCAVAGAFCGTVGSIITAFSVNAVLRELYLAQQFISVTTEALATDQREVPVFTGTEKRYKAAQAHGSRLVWIGVTCLALGFILQALSTLLAQSG